tara:strand:+ start:527 stop:706 length:180 start_codon:yes stop_codon:yes gene_type:complete
MVSANKRDRSNNIDVQQRTRKEHKRVPVSSLRYFISNNKKTIAFVGVLAVFFIVRAFVI